MTDYSEQNPDPKKIPKYYKKREGVAKMPDLTIDIPEADLIALVRQSQVGYIEPGRRPKARAMFFENSNERQPRRDIIHYWRSLYITCHTEYDFALKATGDWELWGRIKRSCRVLRMEWLPLWEQERELGVLSNAYQQINKAVTKGDTKSAQWMVTHLTKFKGKPNKQTKAEMQQKVTDALGCDILDSVEENYKHLN